MNVTFACPSCGAEMELDEQYAGQQTSCPACQTALIVPAPAAVSTAPGKSCPNCGNRLPVTAVVCTLCGCNPATGRPYVTKPAPARPGRFVLTLIVGAVAAVLGGLIWGQLGIWSDREFGWIAWLIGLAIGLTVRGVSGTQSIRNGVMAALLAGGGILIGKAIIMEHIFQTYAAGELQFVEANYSLLAGKPSEAQLTELLTARMVETGELPDADAELTQMESDEVDPESSAWNQAYTRAEEQRSRNREVAQVKLKTMSDKEREMLTEQAFDQAFVAFMLADYLERGELKSQMDDEALAELYSSADITAEKIQEAHMLYMLESDRLQRETLRKVAALTPAERTQAEAKMKAAYEDTIATYHKEVRRMIYKDMFGVMDILFFALALFSAFQLATRERVTGNS